jgi:hypothetical protein
VPDIGARETDKEKMTAIMTGTAGSRAGVSRGSMAIAAFSTVVEWYDFTLYPISPRCWRGCSSAAARAG